MPNISLTGTALEDEPDHYWLNLYEDKTAWMAEGSPPGNQISRTKTGKWVHKTMPDKGVYALESSGEVVFFFRDLNPGTDTVGKQGNGHAHESGRNISWRIDSL